MNVRSNVFESRRTGEGMLVQELRKALMVTHRYGFICRVSLGVTNEGRLSGSKRRRPKQCPIILSSFLHFSSFQQRKYQGVSRIKNRNYSH